MTEPKPTPRTGLTAREEEALSLQRTASSINAYWDSKGYRANARIEETRGQDGKLVMALTSDLLSGYPPGHPLRPRRVVYIKPVYDFVTGLPK